MPLHETIETLRRVIDRGGTGEKVDFPDPAAVPLGADDEAGGTPVTSTAVRAALRQEMRRPSKSAPIGRPPSLVAWFYAAFILVLALGMLLAAMLA